jgi:hypothetical protein
MAADTHDACPGDVVERRVEDHVGFDPVGRRGWPLIVSLS